MAATRDPAVRDALAVALSAVAPAEPRLVFAYLFGSAGTSQERADSDLDVVV